MSLDRATPDEAGIVNPEKSEGSARTSAIPVASIQGFSIRNMPVNATLNVEDPELSVVVVNYNTGHLLDRMFEALENAKGSTSIEVFVVDNASIDNSVEVLETRYPDAYLIKNAVNVGFGRANNQAISHIRGRYVLLLNTDAFVADDTLEKTIAYMDANPRCGILGVRLIGADGALQPSCRYFPTPWNAFLERTGLFRFFSTHRLVDDMSWDHASIRQCDWVPGCYYLIRREVVEQVGLFDPRYFLYFEEVDHCRTVRNAGWQVIYYPFTEVVHVGGESAKTTNQTTRIGRQVSMLQIESELLYFRKYYGIAGLMAGVVLSIIASLWISFKGLIRRDLVEASTAWRQVSTVLNVLWTTRLAGHSTR